MAVKPRSRWADNDKRSHARGTVPRGRVWLAAAAGGGQLAETGLLIGRDAPLKHLLDPLTKSLALHVLFLSPEVP